MDFSENNEVDIKILNDIDTKLVIDPANPKFRVQRLLELFCPNTDYGLEEMHPELIKLMIKDRKSVVLSGILRKSGADKVDLLF